VLIAYGSSHKCPELTQQSHCFFITQIRRGWRCRGHPNIELCWAHLLEFREAFLLSKSRLVFGESGAHCSKVCTQTSISVYYSKTTKADPPFAAPSRFPRILRALARLNNDFMLPLSNANDFDAASSAINHLQWIYIGPLICHCNKRDTLSEMQVNLRYVTGIFPVPWVYVDTGLIAKHCLMIFFLCKEFLCLVSCLC
jgi:hypothetical protein